MKSRPVHLIVLATIWLILSTRANSEGSRQWTRIAGKPTITSMTEDDDLYWIGTDVGLCRMHKTDGTVRVYDRSNSSISSDRVCQLAVHPFTNDLWVATDRGVCRYDRDKFSIPEGIPIAGPLECSHISIDSSGGVWIALRVSGFRFAMGRIDTLGRYTDILLNNPGFPGSIVHAKTLEMHADKFGGVWIHSVGMFDNVLTYLHGGRWRTFTVSIHSPALDNKGRLWFIGLRDRLEYHDGLACISNARDIVWIDSLSLPFEPRMVREITGLPEGNGILVSDTGSFYRYRDGEWEKIGIQTSDEHRLLYTAQNGDLWFQADHRKLLMAMCPDSVNSIELPFPSPYEHFLDITCTPDGTIAAIARDSGVEQILTYTSGGFQSIETFPDARYIVAGPDGSLYLNDRKSGGLLGIFTDTLFTRGFGRYTAIIGDIAIDTSGLLVFETRSRMHSQSYLTRYDPVQRKRLSTIRHSQPIKSGNGLVVDRKNIMWGCSEDGGLIACDLCDSTWTKYAEIDTHASANEDFFSLVLDSSGHLWAGGSSSNVIQFNADGMVEKVYRLPGILGLRVNLHCAAPDGSIWLSHREEYNAPFYACRIQNDSITVFNSHKDPFFSITRSATVDTSGNVWFCTDRGVVVFNPDGIVDRPALAARKEEPRDQQFGKIASPLRILRTDGLSALRINLPEPARVEYTIFDSRGRTVAMRDAGRLPVGDHRLSFGGNRVGSRAGAVLFVRVRVTATGGESTTHILRCVHKGL